MGEAPKTQLKKILEDVDKRKYLPTYAPTIALKERVFLALERYPNMKPKAICDFLHLEYHI